MEKARVFRRVMAERKIMKSWRKYMQIMKTIVSLNMKVV